MPVSDRTAASTFNRVAIDLAHEAFPELAAALRTRTDRILKHWRDLSLKAMPHLDALTLEEFENTIAEILSAAADAVQSADPQHLRGVVEGASSHGVDRFVQKHSLLDLFEEVRILRAVIIFEIAEELKRPLNASEAETFHAIFDIIIQQGVMALVQKQNEEVGLAQATTREINQQLLVSVVRQDALLEQARRSEEALRQSEERYRTLFDLGPVAIYSIDSSGVIQDFNHQAANLWGREPSLGDTDERFCGSLKMFRPDGTFMPHDQCPMAEVVSGRISEVRDSEVVIERPDGSRVTVIVNIRPLKNPRGEVTGAVNCFYDISDRVALENQVRQQAEALAGESRRKDEFLAMLSHELRNPLAPIRSAVYLMKMQEQGSENLIQQQAREIIERQVANLTKIVSDLLEVSRVVSGRIRLEQQAVNMNRVLEHAIETATPLIEQRKHVLKLNLCNEANSVWVNIDPTRMEEVFINLLNNAAKYTPDGGRIEVWCEQPDGSNVAQVRVRDNGVGIDKELLPRIFDLFTQADRSLARSAGGLGIGLSLAHRLVDLHGGTIEAHSPPVGETQGSEFVVRLPLMAAPPAQTQTPVERLQDPEGVRILVVDDNIDLVMMLASTLRQKGYSVQVAYTGPDGLKIAQQWRPDVTLLDIGLPGLNGYDVARRLRADHTLESAGARMKLIALNGYGRDSDLILAREAGFDGHLIKPVEFKSLERMMAAPSFAPKT